MKRIALAVFASLSLLSAAQAAEEDPKAGTMTAGVVRKIDRDSGKLSIAHEPIANLNMAKMTMVFRVREAAMLDLVKEGDSIRFAADRIQGALTVTRIEVAK